VIFDLMCPVRNCLCALRVEAHSLSCTAGHRFDRARSGYVNLLTPQESSFEPIRVTQKTQFMARRRSLDRGLGNTLLATLAQKIPEFGLPNDARVLDAGCGEGFTLGHLCDRFPFAGCGVDISSAACDMAARRYKKCFGSLRMPTERFRSDGSARPCSVDYFLQKFPEFRRLLKPTGRLVVAVSAEDDLQELRAAVLGRALSKDRRGAHDRPLC